MRHLLRTTALAAMVALSGAASAVTINFDVDGNGNPIAMNTAITNQYANQGVLFSGLENGATTTILAGRDPDGVTAPSGSNVLTNCASATSGCPGNRADIVRIDFLAPVSDISLMLDTLGGSSVTFNLYDALDNLLETQSVTSGTSAYVPVNFASANVSRIDGLQPFDGWAWSMDNLSFNASVAAVPEPASWAMMISGFGLVGGAMRRTNREAKLAYA